MLISVGLYYQTELSCWVQKHSDSSCCCSTGSQSQVGAAHNLQVPLWSAVIHEDGIKAGPEHPYEHWAWGKDMIFLLRFFAKTVESISYFHECGCTQHWEKSRFVGWFLLLKFLIRLIPIQDPGERESKKGAKNMKLHDAVQEAHLTSSTAHLHSQYQKGWGECDGKNTKAGIPSGGCGGASR